MHVSAGCRTAAEHRRGCAARTAPTPAYIYPNRTALLLQERHHAELLMEYQNVRGGKVKLGTIMMPEMEFDHPEKGEIVALFFEIA